MAASPYFDIAVERARQFRTEHQGARAIVREFPHGARIFPHAHADVFRANILTLTAHADNKTIHEYAMLSWTDVTVYDADGDIAYRHANPLVRP